MVPNTYTAYFIFIYFYWYVYKFLDFWGTPKIHKMDHIGYKTPLCKYFCFYVIIAQCLYGVDIIVVFIFRSAEDDIWLVEIHGFHSQNFEHMESDSKLSF